MKKHRAVYGSLSAFNSSNKTGCEAPESFYFAKLHGKLLNINTIATEDLI